VDKKKLKQGTRVALDMTTLTIMRCSVFLYLIVSAFYSAKSSGTFHSKANGMGNGVSFKRFWKIRKIVEFLEYKPFNQTL